MFKHICVVVASAMFNGARVTAEFDKLSGRLRILDGKRVMTELFPPSSWCALASVAGAHHWGTNPTEDDLLLLIQDFAQRRGDG
jgi:hypothetical protein